jgi:MFS family permease
VGEAAFYVGAASVINDIAPEERRGEALSYFSLALFAGLAVGPVLGETVLDLRGFDSAWVLAAVAAGVAGTLGLRVPDTRPEGAAQRGRTRLIHRAALLPGTVLATIIWGLATFVTFIPLYALEVGLDGSRLFFVENSVILLLIRGFGARLPDVLGPGRCARIASTLVGIGFVIGGLWQEPAGLYVGIGVYSIGHALAFPALMTMAVRGGPPSERAAVVGTFTAFMDGTFGVAAVSAGGIASVFGYGGAFVAAGLVAGAGLALLYVRRRVLLTQKERGDAEGNAEPESAVAS